VDNLALARQVPAGLAVDSPAARWRVPIAVPAAKLALAAVMLVATVTLGQDQISVLIGLLVAAGLGLAGFRDVLVPVRLEADPAGLTVTTGFGRRRQYAWEQVERVRIEERRRLLGRSSLLEVDVDSSLYFFGRSELGVQPLDALDALAALRYHNTP
jgi:hypothetical protein